MTMRYLFVSCLSISVISLLYLLFLNIAEHHVPLISHESDSVKIADGVYYLFVSYAFWMDGVSDIYNTETQFAIMRMITGTNVSSILPVNILPTGLFVFFPFCVFVKQNLNAAYSLWMAFSFGVYVFSLCWWAKAVKLLKVSGYWITVFFLLTTTFSYSMVVNIALAQTGVLLSACLVLLIAAGSTTGRGSIILETVAIVMLSMKPQYLALGMGVLFIKRRFSSIGLCSIAIVLLYILATWRMGVSWPFNYIDMMSMYYTGDLSNAVKDSFATNQMNIFVPNFSEFLGHSTARSISWFFLVVFYLLALVWGIRGQRSIPGENSSNEKIIISSAIVGMLGGYSLFSPHAGFYEELLWTPIFVAFASEAKIRKSFGLLSLPVLVAFMFLLNCFSLFQDQMTSLLFWFLKLTVVLVLLATLRGKLTVRSECVRGLG